MAALRTYPINVNDTTDTITISFGTHPVPVPQPFTELLGQHLHQNTIMLRLRGLGIQLLGALNTALDEHLSVTPPPLVAEALGYSYQAAFLHADAAGDAWTRYANERT